MKASRKELLLAGYYYMYKQAINQMEDFHNELMEPIDLYYLKCERYIYTFVL